MKLSLVVPTMNRAHDLALLLKSLAVQSRPPDEVVIVDQSNNDATRVIVDHFIKLEKDSTTSVLYVRAEEKSLVKARNRGVRESSGDIICFLDDDVILYTDYFERIMFYFQYEDVGGVSGTAIVRERARGVKWEIRKLLMKVFLISDYRGNLTLSTFGYSIFEREISETTTVQLLPGCTMCFRRELLLKNISDDWFQGYGYREDVDLSWRISQQAKLLMVPDARYIHNQSPVNRLDALRLQKMERTAYRYLATKYIGNNWFRRLLFNYSFGGLVFITFLENLSRSIRSRK